MTGMRTALVRSKEIQRNVAEEARRIQLRFPLGHDRFFRLSVALGYIRAAHSKGSTSLARNYAV